MACKECMCQLCGDECECVNCTSDQCDCGRKRPEDKRPEDKRPEDKRPEDKRPEDKKSGDKGNGLLPTYRVVENLEHRRSS